MSLNRAPEGPDAQGMEQMALDIDGADMQELVEHHKEELTTKTISGLPREQQKMLVEEHSIEEEEDREELSSNE